MNKNDDTNEQRRMVTIPRSMLTQLATTHQNVVGEGGISSLADYLYELCFNCIGRDLLHGCKDDCQDEDDSGRDNAKKLIHGASMMIVDLTDKLANLEAGQDLSLRESEAQLLLDNVSKLKKYLSENPTILQDFSEDKLRKSWEYGAPDDVDARVAFAASFAKDPSPTFAVLDQLSRLVSTQLSRTPRPLNILMLDDDVTFFMNPAVKALEKEGHTVATSRDNAVKALEKEGHTVATSRDNKEANALLDNATSPFDLVISDFDLGNGTNASAFIARAVKQNLPVMVWSSMHSDTVYEALSAHGVGQSQVQLVNKDQRALVKAVKQFAVGQGSSPASPGH